MNQKPVLPASDDDGLLTVPAHVLPHNLSMHGHILWSQLGQLVWLGVDPSKGFHLLQVVVVGQHVGKVDVLVGAPLWN